MSDETALIPVSDGQDPTTGRFLPGNRAAKGNATPRKTARFRNALLSCVTPQDFREVVQALMTAAKSGDVSAAKLFLQYVVGTPGDVEMHERLIVLERTLTQRG